MHTQSLMACQPPYINGAINTYYLVMVKLFVACLIFCVWVWGVPFQEELSQERPLSVKTAWENCWGRLPSTGVQTNQKVFPCLLPSQFHPVLISSLCCWNLVVESSSFVWKAGLDLGKRQEVPGFVGVESFSTTPNERMSLLGLLTSAGWHGSLCYQNHLPGHGRWFTKDALETFPTKPTNSYTPGCSSITEHALCESCEFPMFPDPCELPVFLELESLLAPSLSLQATVVHLTL